MLHPKAELLDVLPLLCLLPIVQKDVRLGRVVGGPDADPIGAPVLHLPVGPCLDTADEILDGLEGAPMAQEQVDEAWEPPVVVDEAWEPPVVVDEAWEPPVVVDEAWEPPVVVPDVPISSSSEGKRSSHARRSRRNPGAIPSMP